MRDINLNSVTANVINTKDLTATGNVTLGGGVNTTVKIAENTTVDMGRNRITNIGNATAAHDAVTLEQMNDALRNAGSAPGLVNRVDQLARDLHKSIRTRVRVLRVPLRRRVFRRFTYRVNQASA